MSGTATLQEVKEEEAIGPLRNGRSFAHYLQDFETHLQEMGFTYHKKPVHNLPQYCEGEQFNLHAQTGENMSKLQYVLSYNMISGSVSFTKKEGEIHMLDMSRFPEHNQKISTLEEIMRLILLDSFTEQDTKIYIRPENSKSYE